MSAPTTFRFRSIAGPPLSQANTVSVKDSALVVIDVQNFYLPDNMWPVAGIEKTNERISALVERYRKVRASSCLSKMGLRLIPLPSSPTSGWQRGHLGRSHR